jgi:hypothetical protein
MKSEGKRLMFLLTACFKTFVSTPYSSSYPPQTSPILSFSQKNGSEKLKSGMKKTKQYQQGSKADLTPFSSPTNRSI